MTYVATAATLGTFSESDTTPFGSYVDYILDDKVRKEDEGGREDEGEEEEGGFRLALSLSVETLVMHGLVSRFIRVSFSFSIPFS